MISLNYLDTNVSDDYFLVRGKEFKFVQFTIWNLLEDWHFPKNFVKVLEIQ